MHQAEQHLQPGIEFVQLRLADHLATPAGLKLRPQRALLGLARRQVICGELQELLRAQRPAAHCTQNAVSAGPNMHCMRPSAAQQNLLSGVTSYHVM